MQIGASMVVLYASPGAACHHDADLPTNGAAYPIGEHDHGRNAVEERPQIVLGDVLLIDIQLARHGEGHCTRPDMIQHAKI